MADEEAAAPLPPCAVKAARDATASDCAGVGTNPGTSSSAVDGAPDPKGESGTAGRAGIPLLCPSLFEPGPEMDDMVEVGIPLGTVMSEMLDGPAITELSLISAPRRAYG